MTLRGPRMAASKILCLATSSHAGIGTVVEEEP